MKDKERKKRTKTIPELRDLAWKEFSKYIRLRDGLATLGSKEFGKCFTCDKTKPLWTRGGMQAGHFVNGRGATILFDEEAVHGQCYSCNMMLGGNKDEYTPRMIKKYGLKKVKEMWRRKKQSHHWQKDELEEIREKYKNLFNQLKGSE